VALLNPGGLMIFNFPDGVDMPGTGEIVITKQPIATKRRRDYTITPPFRANKTYYHSA